MSSFQAVFFDFDGVLADSEPIHFECWIEALKPLGIQSDWETYSKYCIGIPDRDAVEYLCRVNPTPVDPGDAWARYSHKRELFAARMLEAPPFSEELVAFLKSLDDYRLAVVTASARSEIEPLLERGGIRPLFDAVVCRDDVERYKPDAYLLASRLLGTKAALVVEDSDAGVASGLAAGLEVLRVPGPEAVPRMVRERLEGAPGRSVGRRE